MGSHDKKTDKYSYVLPGSLFLLSGSVKFCGESPTGSVKKITKKRPVHDACIAVMSGRCPPELASRAYSSVNHSHWVTLALRILMYSMTFNEAAFIFLILMLTNHNELTHNPPPQKKINEIDKTNHPSKWNPLYCWAWWS